MIILSFGILKIFYSMVADLKSAIVWFMNFDSPLLLIELLDPFMSDILSPLFCLYIPLD